MVLSFRSLTSEEECKGARLIYIQSERAGSTGAFMTVKLRRWACAAGINNLGRVHSTFHLLKSRACFISKRKHSRVSGNL